jgi:Peptidase A4 family
MSSVDTWGTNTFPVPPAGFDLGKASDEERVKHGIPRAHRLPELEQRLVETTRGTRFITPKLEPGESVHPRRPAGAPKIEDITPSLNDVGCYVSAPGFPPSPSVPTDNFATIYGEFTVPKVWPPQFWDDPGAEWIVAPWVGMGGASGGSLPQAGVRCGVTDTTGNRDYQYDYAPWIEWAPNPPYDLISADVYAPGGYPAALANPEDIFAVMITYIPWALPEWGTPFGYEVLAVIINRTQGWTSAFLARPPDQEHPFNGYDADWVVEVNSASPGFPIMTNVLFNNCMAWTKAGNLVTPADSNYQHLQNLVDKNNNVLATATQTPPDGVFIAAT